MIVVEIYVAGCYDHGRNPWQAVMIMVEIYVQAVMIMVEMRGRLL